MASAYDGLSAKHRLFVDEFLVDLHQENAAVRAGVPSKAARQAAWRWMRRPDVIDAIKERMESRLKRVEINQDWVIKRLAIIADANLIDVASWSPAGVQLVDSKDLDRDQAYILTEVAADETIKESEGGEEMVLRRNVKAKIALERVKALELLGKHFGMFGDKLQISGDSENPMVAQIVIQPVRPVTPHETD